MTKGNMVKLKKKDYAESSKDIVSESSEIISDSESIIDQDDYSNKNSSSNYDDDEYIESDKGSEDEYKELTDKEEEECVNKYEDVDEDLYKKSTMVPNDERITTNKLTKYERVRILGLREKQIEMGAKVLIKGIEGKSPAEIAELELQYKVIPFIIKRPLPDNTYELWKISELEI